MERRARVPGAPVARASRLDCLFWLWMNLQAGTPAVQQDKKMQAGDGLAVFGFLELVGGVKAEVGAARARVGDLWNAADSGLEFSAHFVEEVLEGAVVGFLGDGAAGGTGEDAEKEGAATTKTRRQGRVMGRMPMPLLMLGNHRQACPARDAHGTSGMVRGRCRRCPAEVEFATWGTPAVRQQKEEPR